MSRGSARRARRKRAKKKQARRLKVVRVRLAGAPQPPAPGVATGRLVTPPRNFSPPVAAGVRVALEDWPGDLWRVDVGRRDE